MAKITSKTLKSATPSSSVYFIRDSELKGFALRVFPSGTIKYIAEVWYNGKSHRKTLGSSLLRMLDGYNKSLMVKCALRLLPLVFVRPGELRMMK